ncbi:hypothetical protein ASD37_13005 [Mycobacterium sp. Root135]|uniref:putative immunity protein n=1 Tax=Mycobacterium sp. Root135 TaxID=1736457 RepID=UPI0006FD588C|nr:hypothetical protein [Mycobacterium sp. Root135]KQY07015.1 hypothetical protein ASD37_13005 [Mycobacterium sp. Root135]
MKKFSRDDQRTMARWALDCAERVLPIFEVASPDDTRPRRAIETGRDWVSTGEFSMAVIRKASLDAHAAAKETTDPAAIAAAHAAGQAVATAHVPQHAYGGAYYALRAIAARSPAQNPQAAWDEHSWQAAQLPDHLRAETMDRIVIDQTGSGLRISIRKGSGF